MAFLLRCLRACAKPRIVSRQFFPVRNSCNLPDTCPKEHQGLILGLYSLNDGRHETAHWTSTAEKLNKLWCNRLEEMVRIAGPCPKLAQTRILFGMDPLLPVVCVVGLGHECAGYDETELMDQAKENIRVAAASGARAVEDFHLSRLYVESFGHAESAAEGAALAIWIYQEFKNAKKRKHITTLDLYDCCDWTGWQIGLQKAAAQNLAKQIIETPANHMTPIIFAQTSVEILCKAGINVEVKVANWAEQQGMGGLLAVGKGSCHAPLFMEISYYGAENFKERPIVLIGKGNTFDSGGMCLQPPSIINHMRGDVGGAAIVVAMCRAISALQLPINVRGLIPLAEHMPGCNAMKPGDVVVIMNGKSVFIQDTRCEGRLMLADALCYAQQFWPKFIVTVGSMTRGCLTGLSTAASGCFSNSDRLWEQLKLAAVHTGDRVWRLPLWDIYTNRMTATPTYDTLNYGRRPSQSDPARCAGFLKEFVPCGEWLHIDTFGVMRSDGYTDTPYLRHGMTGRPTRTLIEFMSQLCCCHSD